MTLAKIKVAYRDTCALNQQPPAEARQHLRTQSQRRHHNKQGAERVNQQRLLPLTLSLTALAWLTGIAAVSAHTTTLRHITRKLKG